MKLISVHSHLLKNPSGLDEFVESGLFSQVWLLQLPESNNPDKNSWQASTEQEILDVSKRYPGFFLPFKWVDFRYGADQIDRAVDQGFVGFKGICPQYAYDDDRYYPIYEKIASYHSVMVFHTGFVATPPYEKRRPGFFYHDGNMRPAFLRQLAALFPKMNFVAAHFGIPWEKELLDRDVYSCPNLYVDLSGGHVPEILQIVEQHAMHPARLSNGEGGIFADRLLFGADVYIGHPQLHEDIKGYCQRFLDFFRQKKEEKVSWADRIPGILRENAERILRENQLMK